MIVLVAAALVGTSTHGASAQRAGPVADQQASPTGVRLLGSLFSSAFPQITTPVTLSLDSMTKWPLSSSMKCYHAVGAIKLNFNGDQAQGVFVVFPSRRDAINQYNATSAHAGVGPRWLPTPSRTFSWEPSNHERIVNRVFVIQNVIVGAEAISQNWDASRRKADALASAELRFFKAALIHRRVVPKRSILSPSGVRRAISRIVDSPSLEVSLVASINQGAESVTVRSRGLADPSRHQASILVDLSHSNPPSGNLTVLLLDDRALIHFPRELLSGVNLPIGTYWISETVKSGVAFSGWSLTAIKDLTPNGGGVLISSTPREAMRMYRVRVRLSNALAIDGTASTLIHELRPSASDLQRLVWAYVWIDNHGNLRRVVGSFAMGTAHDRSSPGTVGLTVHIALSLTPMQRHVLRLTLPAAGTVIPANELRGVSFGTIL